eukprot:403360494
MGSKASASVYGLNKIIKDEAASQLNQKLLASYNNNEKLGQQINEAKFNHKDNSTSVQSTTRSRAQSQKSVREQGQGQQTNQSPYLVNQTASKQTQNFTDSLRYQSNKEILQNSSSLLNQDNKFEATSWEPEHYDQGVWNKEGRKLFTEKNCNYSSTNYDIVQNMNQQLINSRTRQSRGSSLMYSTIGDNFESRKYSTQSNAGGLNNQIQQEWSPYNKTQYSSSNKFNSSIKVESPNKKQNDRPHELRSTIVDKYLVSLLQDDSKNNKVEIVNAMYEMNVDNRILNNLRQTMNGLVVEEKGLLSVNQFRELFLSFFKDNLKCNTIYDLLLPVILVMNSNKQNKSHLQKSKDVDNEKHTFTQLLSLIWAKIYERFPNINAAFRFFDSNYDQEIHFNEFAQGIEYLRLKLSYEDIWKIYRYMDTNGDGHIGYSEFCQLCEEKWRNIDPFETLQSHKEQQQKRLIELKDKELQAIENAKRQAIQSQQNNSDSPGNQQRRTTILLEQLEGKSKEKLIQIARTNIYPLNQLIKYPEQVIIAILIKVLTLEK